MNRSQLFLVTFVIFAAALSRLLPHPPNVTPVAAMALVSGAYLANRTLAFLVPLLAMIVSDLIIGFHPGMFAVYLGMMFMTLIGFTLKHRRGALRVGAVTLLGSVGFFLITNFIWLQNESLYPYNFEGMVQSYVAALPYFRNTVLGDLFYSALMFGGLYALSLRGTGRKAA